MRLRGADSPLGSQRLSKIRLADAPIGASTALLKSGILRELCRKSISLRTFAKKFTPCNERSSHEQTIMLVLNICRWVIRFAVHIAPCTTTHGSRKPDPFLPPAHRCELRRKYCGMLTNRSYFQSSVLPRYRPSSSQTVPAI
jgi:hypothetical protein